MKLLRSPDITWRFIRVWGRDVTVYRKTWAVNFMTPLLEPLFYLLAFSLGLGALIEKVPFEGDNLSYVVFITPALLAVAVMYNAFFENTFASFVRMYYQKTFDAILATPLSLDEIVTGEIAWGATKSVVAAVIVLGVVSAFGLVHYPHALLTLPVAFLGGIAFGSIGMFFTGIIPSIEMFNLPVFLFITPMFLFSGTFFPIDGLPHWVRQFAAVLPLTHLVDLTRHLCLGMLPARLLWNVAYLVAFCLIFYPLALAAMHRRLVH